jgi:cyclopropane fatty-acyl-phospholipid synthase-like methyltransferase
MGYFDDESTVHKYIEMAQGYDGRGLIDILRKYLQEGYSVLEIGMGPGKDLDILRRYYNATGSDSSQIFLDLYRKNNRDTDLLLLDARTLDTDCTFDCIYSNKVLHHLTKIELKESLKRQRYLLTPRGLIFHSFWEGDRIEEMHGLRFVYYRKDVLAEIFEECYDLLEIETYTEIEENDSIYVVAMEKCD